jgi:WD40-like Beta Propeller Repeat
MIRLFSFVLLSFFAEFVTAQTGSEIILFDLRVAKNTVIISNGKNITNHKGYDNQPFFHPKKTFIYFSSFNDSGRSDLKYYDFKDDKTKNLTVTNEREYSPTVTPDGKHISCIIQRDNGEQNLGQYPIKGGAAQVLIKDLIVGYHAWIAKDKLLLFVLGDSLHPNTLHYVDLRLKKDTILAENIGRSLHHIPGTKLMSFVQKVSDKEQLIKQFDPRTMMIKTITATKGGQDHLTWLNDHKILMSDGVNLFVYDVIANNGWQLVTIEGDAAMLKGITRLAVNKKSSKLAVVVSE